MRNFKRILITGIVGSGGSYLAEHLLKKKSKFKIFGIYRKKKFKNIKNIKKKIKLHKCDLNNFKSTKNVLNLIKPDLIFHLASNPDVRKSFDYPLQIINNNNNCTLNLLESIRVLKINPLIVVCSTSEVYGLVSKKDVPINENNRLNPASPYAVSKLFQDILSQTYYRNFGLKIIITRMFSYFNVRRFNLFSSNWTKQMVDIEKNRSKILYHGNLNSIRAILDIDDAMEAYWMAASKGKIGEIYNIGGNKIINLKNFLKILISYSTKKIKTKLDKKLLRKTDVTLQIPNVAKFNKYTGWKPKVSFEKSIEKMINEIRLM